MRLYDLSIQYQDLLDLIDIDAPNEELQAMIDGLEDRIEEKIDAVLSVRNSKLAEAKALRTEMIRLAERISRTEKDAKRLELLVESTMRNLGIENLKTFKFSTWMQKNPQSVQILDDSLVPQKYYTVPSPELSKLKILEAWKNGIEVPGTEIKQEKSLRIK